MRPISLVVTVALMAPLMLAPATTRPPSVVAPSLARATLSTGAACATSPAEARSQVARLEQEWETAFYRRDTAFFRRTLGDDFVMAGGPKPGGKQDYIANQMAGSTAPSTVTGSPPPMNDIRAFGDVVIVSGVWTNKAAPAEKAAYTEVFVCRNGQWKAVHGHYNAIPPTGR